MIDLHCHSTFSDGEFSPVQLLEMAAAIGLSALALTDHDTVAGLPSLLAAESGTVTAVPGVEVSAMFGSDTLHILGLFVDWRCPELNRFLEPIRSSREERNRKIVRRLRNLGCDVTEEDVRARAGEDVVGRPHIAQSLVAAGCCESIPEAFEVYLGVRGKAYYKRFRPSAESAVRTVHAAGGLAVWAHPVAARDHAESTLRQRLRSLRDAGLDGIESHYSEHTEEQTRFVSRLADEAGLLLSGGSDFHGAPMPGIELGRGRGNLAVPDQFLDRMRNKIAAETTRAP